MPHKCKVTIFVQQLIVCLFLMFLTYKAIAQKELPKTLAEELAESPHQPLRPTTPQYSAIVEWHEIFESNNFGAYQKSSSGTLLSLFGKKSVDMQKAMFDEIKNSAPTNILITKPAVMPSGNFLFHARGCKAGYLRENMIAVSFDGKQWRALGGIWFPDTKKTTCNG